MADDFNTCADCSLPVRGAAFAVESPAEVWIHLSEDWLNAGLFYKG